MITDILRKINTFLFVMEKYFVIWDVETELLVFYTNLTVRIVNIRECTYIQPGHKLCFVYPYQFATGLSFQPFILHNQGCRNE